MSHGEQDTRPSSAAPDPVSAPASVSSTELMQGRRQIIIRHDGEHYRLQITRRGKLILTK